MCGSEAWCLNESEKGNEGWFEKERCTLPVKVE